MYKNPNQYNAAHTARNRQLLSQVYKKASLLESAQLDVPPGMMRVKGVVAKMNIVNNNNRFYTAQNYKAQISNLQSKIEEGLFGEMEHPKGFNIDYNQVSHKIEELYYDDSTDEVHATMLLLDNDKGKTAQAIVRSGGALRCSTRAAGYVDKKQAVIEELFTIDLVGTPGFSEAKLYLAESVGSSHAYSNDNNVTLLKEDNLNEVYILQIQRSLNESVGRRKITRQSLNESIARKLSALALQEHKFIKTEAQKLAESFKRKVTNK